ncbi:MAG TPA: sugar nucleotide-binding protein [Pirellulales bacterium]|jgi:dTDP-4-dehydrorhamnose reductase|nr:sugar nucleotide-binding protein [Pirellulales bacterium]
MLRRATFAVEPPLPLLVTGISGVAGYNVLPYLQARYPGQVIGIRQRDNWRLAGSGIEECNAEDRPTLERLFEQYQFSAVLNCAGNCALKSCELDPAMAWRINVDGVRSLLEICVQRQVRFVHLSIDLVFSGAGCGGHVETDRTDPVTVYGKTMVAAEEMILKAADSGRQAADGRRKEEGGGQKAEGNLANGLDSQPPAANSQPFSACILRISLPMGVSFNGHAGAIDWIQSRFKKDRPATLYFDEIRTPTYTDCLNEMCEAVLASELTGLYHAGAPRRLSLYNIAQIINRVGGYDPKLLMGCPRKMAGPIPPRAGNVSLNSNKLADALGYDPLDPWPLKEEFVPTHAQWHFERSSFKGSKELLAEVLYRNPGKV